MRKSTTNPITIGFVLLLAFMAGCFVALLWVATLPTTRAQIAQPTPEVVNQHWHVKHGDVEVLQDTLEKLNADGVKVGEKDITISTDAKRFVIVSFYDPNTGEDEP